MIKCDFFQFNYEPLISSTKTEANAALLWLKIKKSALNIVFLIKNKKKTKPFYFFI